MCFRLSIASTSHSPRLALHLLAGLLGAALLSLPGSFYRIDRVACANWPPSITNSALATVYVAAVALLAICWRGFWLARPSLRSALAAGALVHAVALLAVPFLSTDPLFYAALGRAMAKYHASPYAPLRFALPSGDPLLRLLSIDWQRGTSAYFPGWNELARGIAQLAGDDLLTHLRLYQLLGFLSMTAAAGLSGLAVGVRNPAHAGSAAAAVLFCPLAVIEGTLSAHNDGLLALLVALLVFATATQRPLIALLVAALALAIKASALLLFGFTAVALLAARWRLATAWLAVAALLLLATAIGLIPKFRLEIGRVTDLLNPQLLQCERAIECLPRWMLWRSRHFAAASAIGIAFRIAGALWLLYAAVRAGHEKRFLPWFATGIFVYYLYFHAYVQAWYLLPLLPLLPFSNARIRPAMAASCVTWICHYAVVFCVNCRASTAELWIERVLGVALVVLVPSVLLLREGWKRITCRRFRSPRSRYR